MVEHPVNREATLGPSYSQVVIGSVEEDGQWLVAAVALEPPADAADARQVAHSQIAARWTTDGGPKPAPRLEAELDDLASRVASGALPNKRVNKELGKLFKMSHLVRGAANALVVVVPPGEEPDTGDLVLPQGARHLYADGNLGAGAISYAVLVIVVSSEAN
jgi:hypothetical protein